MDTRKIKSAKLVFSLVSALIIATAVTSAPAVASTTPYSNDANTVLGGAGTGTHNASGTYTWNSTTGVMAFNVTSTDFTCDGPKLGTETFTVTTVTATTMALVYPDGWTDTWSRPSGTAGDIVGTWTISDSTTGNSYTTTLDARGTVSVTGVIVKCSSGGGGSSPSANPSANTQHWSNGYSVILNYNDPTKAATTVSATGPGISGSAVLSYNAGRGSWDSWTSPSTPVSFGTAYPTGLPYTYTFTITDATSTRTATSTVSCFQVPLVTNTSPTGSVTGPLTFSWTGVADPSPIYGVQVNDSNGNWMWANYKISATSIAYNGPALISGVTYGYAVSLQSSSACSNGTSFAQGSFTYGNGGAADTTAPTVPTGVNAVAAGSNRVNLSWNSSTDNVGVTYYQVYRNGVAAGTPAGASNTFWPDDQVTAGNTYAYTVSACDAAGNCSTQSSAASAQAGTGVSQFDGTYTGSWNVTCPACGDTAAGTFTTTLATGIFTNIIFAIESGTHSPRFDSGTVSSSGAITGTGASPSQCNSSVSTFTGQITGNSSGGAGMSVTYSRPASDTCAAETGTVSAARTASGSTTSSSAQLTSGWNLLGNSSSGALSVVTAFGNSDKVSTVWKWIANGARWAFYAPSLVGQALTDYVSAKGYDVLTTINGGEGFWVNAKADFTAQLPAGTAISSTSFQSMASGWNLIAIGDHKTPRAFNGLIGLTPPTAGDIPLNLTTLWAWDVGQTNWYFYAPSLDKSSGLSSYISSKGYLDFGTKVLDPTTGFWINK